MASRTDELLFRDEEFAVAALESLVVDLEIAGFTKTGKLIVHRASPGEVKSHLAPGAAGCQPVRAGSQTASRSGAMHE